MMDRFELRRQARMGMRGVPERLGLSFARGNIEMRAKPSGHGSTNFEWLGYATVYNAEFDMWDQDGEPFTEDVAPGAAKRSLANPNLDVPFLIGHNNAGIPLARTKSGTMTLRDDSTGVLTHVPEMDGRREEVRALASANERGDIDEMSLAFICLRQQWDQSYEHRTVLEMDLHRGDVCAVTHGANPATAGASMFAVEQLAYRRPAVIGGPVLLGRERRASAADDMSLSLESDYNPGPVTPGLTCPQCQAGNHGGAKFCDQCGHSFGAGTSATVVVDDTTGIPGEESQFSAARRLELRMRELDLEELARR
jgi:HK97 family phage prohead protease